MPPVEDITLKPGHAWRARPGCTVFVAERGAVRFDYPRQWVAVPDETSISFYDGEPPDDDSRLTVSFMRLPATNWGALKMESLLESALQGGEPEGTRGPIHVARCGDVDLAWRELSFIDAAQSREARSRTCVARQGTLQCLLTFDFWADDLGRCHEAWTTVLETLELDRPVADPRRGPMVS
jgi:hypothetical protein